MAPRGERYAPRWEFFPLPAYRPIIFGRVRRHSRIFQLIAQKPGAEEKEGKWATLRESGRESADCKRKRATPDGVALDPIGFRRSVADRPAAATEALRAGQLLALLQRFLRHVKSSNWILFAPTGSTRSFAFPRPIRSRSMHQPIRKTSHLAKRMNASTSEQFHRGEKTPPRGEYFHRINPFSPSRSPPIGSVDRESLQGGQFEARKKC